MCKRISLQISLALGLALVGLALVWSGLSLAQGPTGVWQHLSINGANFYAEDPNRLLVAPDGNVYACPQGGVYGVYKLNQSQNVWQPLTGTVGIL
jgi:hypothetical protein